MSGIPTNSAIKVRERVGKLTSKAYTRSTIEGEEFPAWSCGFPSLWPELLCVLAPEVLAALHGVDGVSDSVALGHEKRRLSVRAAS